MQVFESWLDVESRQNQEITKRIIACRRKIADVESHHGEEIPRDKPGLFLVSRWTWTCTRTRQDAALQPVTRNFEAQKSQAPNDGVNPRVLAVGLQLLPDATPNACAPVAPEHLTLKSPIVKSWQYWKNCQISRKFEGLPPIFANRCAFCSINCFQDQQDLRNLAPLKN